MIYEIYLNIISDDTLILRGANENDLRTILKALAFLKKTAQKKLSLWNTKREIFENLSICVRPYILESSEEF